MLDAAVLKGIDLGHAGPARDAKVFRFLARVRHQRDPGQGPKHATHNPCGHPGFARRLGGHPRPRFAVAVGALLHHHGTTCDGWVSVEEGLMGGVGGAAVAAVASGGHWFYGCRGLLEVCGHGVRRDFFHQRCDGESFGRRGVAGLCEKDIGLAWYGG